MTELKREVVKYIRDYIKKDYKFKDECYVCGETEDLDLHHIYSLSQLWNDWLTKNKINPPTTVEDVTELRKNFAEETSEQLAHDNLYTLCGEHHKQLHNIYGQRYSNALSPKIKRWLGRMKDKCLGTVT